MPANHRPARRSRRCRARARTLGRQAKRNLEVISRSHRMRASRAIGLRPNTSRPSSRSYGLDGRRGPAVSGGRQDDVRHAEVPACLGREVGRVVGTRERRKGWVRAHEDCRLGIDTAVPRRGQRQRRRDGGPRRCRCRHAMRTTRGKDVRGKLVLARRSLTRSRRSRSALRRRRHRQLRAEPANGVVGRECRPAALGPPRLLCAAADFAFMVRPSQARAWQARLAAGETRAVAGQGRCRPARRARTTS